jgi:alanine racemase
MDMCMIDLTGVVARENDEVVVFGEPQPITRVAETLDTIPYEVLTNISRRVKRVYFQE